MEQFTELATTARRDGLLALENKLADIRRITTPADGKTIVGDWLIPLAWNARAGTVTVTAPKAQAGRVLADYRVEPNHLVRWSAPRTQSGSWISFLSSEAFGAEGM